MTISLSSGNVKAQERTSIIVNILETVAKLIDKSQFNVAELSALFDGVLNPVAAKSQRKVVIPQGLDLDAWINDPPSESEDETVPIPNQYENTNKNTSNIFYGENYYHGSNQDSYSGEGGDYKKTTYVEPSAEELESQKKTRKESENINPYYIKGSSGSKVEATPNISATTDRPQPPPSAPQKGAFPASLQLSLSDQIYRQTKIDEENRRLKKKSKADGSSSKKGKKSKKTDTTTVDENDEDLYPTIKVTRGGELPEGTTESGNEDNDDELSGKNKKLDPHRALNIDLDAKPIEKPVAPPVQIKETVVEPVKKPKKKKTTEKGDKPKRERGEYNELSPMDDQSKSIIPKTTKTSEEKPKKKKSKEKKTSEQAIVDIMSHDIDSSDQQNNEQNNYKLIAQSDYLTIESSITPILSSTQLDVTFLLKNRTSSILDQIDIHVIDSMSSKLLHTTSPNHISFPSISLFPYSQNYLHVYFSIHGISFPQKLKTTLTYSINKSSNDKQTDTIEFKLDLPCSQYLIKKSLKTDAFTDLMSSGTLTSQSHLSIPTSNQDFSSLIKNLCQTYRLTIVEQINSAASLYSETILGHPIALLLKSTNPQNGISIDGKSTETHFLSNLMEEIKVFLQN